eukprot:TRINITY_DN56701_c0_g1_i1.p1 TRINITY_DN56701_c0_g1~~TRINITY_DN56701_c0_g1_i1.p1  ORF type:complete len:206 (-),score=15.92 TRINITY_DN56701_c0_g1_i1:79-696(-)
MLRAALLVFVAYAERDETARPLLDYMPPLRMPGMMWGGHGGLGWHGRRGRHGFYGGRVGHGGHGLPFGGFYADDYYYGWTVTSSEQPIPGDTAAPAADAEGGEPSPAAPAPRAAPAPPPAAATAAPGTKAPPADSAAPAPAPGPTGTIRHKHIGKGRDWKKPHVHEDPDWRYEYEDSECVETRHGVRCHRGRMVHGGHAWTRRWP